MAAKSQKLLTRALLITVISAVTACDDGGREFFGGLSAGFETQIVVLPGGSVVLTRYWVVNGFGDRIEEITAADLPTEGKAVVKVTIQHVASRPLSSVTAPTSLAAADTTITALFAGGRIPGGANASTRAAVAIAGQPLVTGLNMIAARTEHAMATLPGDRVLITGGYGPGTPTPVLGSAEVFTFATRTFAATGPMSVGRGDHAAAALADGRVLVTGGLVLSGGGPATIDVASTEIFSPTTNTFSNGPAMTTTRFNHSAVTLNDGRVLVLGGNGRRTAEVYSPSTNTFTAVGDMSVVHGNGHIAVLLASGKVLVTGGDLANINPTAVVEVFDPATNTFAVVGNMSAPRMQHFAVLTDDGRVLIGGGRTTGGGSLNTTEFFNPATNAFTPAVTLPAATSDVIAAFVKQKK